VTASPAGTRRLIDEFLKCRRIAIAGVSRNPRDFSAGLFREFLKRGYDAVPVNPNAAQVEGRTCYPRVQDIQPPVEAALLVTRPEVSARVVKDCAEASIHLVWMLRTADPAATEFYRQHGLGIIAGYCPYLFLPEAAWFHRLHGWFMRLTGAYPD